MPSAVLADFAPIGGQWCCFWLRIYNRRAIRSMSAEPQRTCPSCGSEFSGAMEFCPVCMLRKGLAGGIESGESSFQEAIQPTSGQLANSDTRSRGGHELGQSFALL